MSHDVKEQMEAVAEQKIAIDLYKNGQNRKVMEPLFRWTSLVFAGLIVLSLAAMILVMVVESWPSITTFGIRFIWDTAWNPVTLEFGALPYIYGTVVSSIIAILVATPISIGCALFLTEMAPSWIRAPIGFLIELLAAIPSILFGLWGLFVFMPFVREYIQVPLNQFFGFIPLFAGEPRGLGMLSAGLLLAIMIIPIITALARDVISAVPSLQKEGALALGATKWEVMRKVILPYSRVGILGAVMLGLGRALGETMAVIMIIGNRPEINLSLLEPGQSMAGVIATQFNESIHSLHVSALIEIGLLLFLVTFLLNVIARFLIWKVSGGKNGVRVVQ